MHGFSFRAIRGLKFATVVLLPLVMLSVCVTGVTFGFAVFDAAGGIQWFAYSGGHLTFLPLNVFLSTLMFLMSAVVMLGSMLGLFYSAIVVLPWAWFSELPHTVAEIEKGSYIVRYGR